MRYKIFEYMNDGSLKDTGRTVEEKSVAAVFKLYGFTGTTYCYSYSIDGAGDIKYASLKSPIWKLVKEEAPKVEAKL